MKYISGNVETYEGKSILRQLEHLQLKNEKQNGCGNVEDLKDPRRNLKER